MNQVLSMQTSFTTQNNNILAMRGQLISNLNVHQKPQETNITVKYKILSNLKKV